MTVFFVLSSFFAFKLVFGCAFKTLFCVKARTFKISSALSVKTAPSLISLFEPAERFSNGEAGTAKISLFCSKPRRAVISEPELSDASTTVMPFERAEMMRLRRGKFCTMASV